VLVQLAIFLFGFFVIDTRLLPFSRGVPTIVGEGFRSSKEMNENDSMARSYNSRRMIICPHNSIQTAAPSLFFIPYSLFYKPKIAISRYFGNGKIVVILQRQKM
jgi:hypothetical protein